MVVYGCIELPTAEVRRESVVRRTMAAAGETGMATTKKQLRRRVAIDVHVTGGSRTFEKRVARCGTSRRELEEIPYH